MPRNATNAQAGDVLMYQSLGSGQWQYALFEFNSATAALTLDASANPSLNPMGSSAGNIPTNLIPLSCMNLSMTLPMRATGNVVSVDVATTSAAGVISAADLTSVRSALQPGASIPWSTVTGTPASLSGYGIIDGVSINGSYANPTWLTSFAYSKLTGAPSLATVATTGAYGDLSGKPTIPAAQVNSDWNAVSGVSQILNKPSLAAVAISGAYTDLTGTPTLGSAAAQNTSFFATAAQGSKADTACQSGTGALSVTATVMSIVAASVSVAGTMSAADFSKLASYPDFVARSFTNNVTLTIQTVAAAGNGSQVSTTRDAVVSYSASVTTTSTIGGPQAGTIVLEICSTNSSTAANWQEISRITNSQTITLAVALQSIQINAAALVGMVPAGFFRRLRSITTSGSPAFAYNSGQEVLL